MKIKKEALIGIVVIVVVISALTLFLGNQRAKARGSFAQRINALGNNPTESVESLQKAISIYENRIEQHVKDAAQTGVYWKILAIRLQDRNLHNEALNALERAVYYNPTDPVLHYLTGVSAVIVGKNSHDYPGNANPNRVYMYNLGEEAFLRAIDLDPKYLKPHYSLGILYSFDLDRPEDAVIYLEKALQISRNDVDSMFVLARSYYMLSMYSEAVELYDRIINTTKDKDKIREAQDNRQLVMGRIYG